MTKLNIREQKQLYEEIINSLKSCEEEEDCSECEQIGECIHYLRKCLVLIFQNHIIRLQENTKKYKEVIQNKKSKGYFT